MAERSCVSTAVVGLLQRNTVRVFRWGVVYDLVFANRLCLFVWESEATEGTLYEYWDEEEFRKDRQRVLGFGDDTAGAGVPAPDRPNPPTRKDTLPFPFLATTE